MFLIMQTDKRLAFIHNRHLKQPSLQYVSSAFPGVQHVAAYQFAWTSYEQQLYGASSSPLKPKIHLPSLSDSKVRVFARLILSSAICSKVVGCFNAINLHTYSSLLFCSKLDCRLSMGFYVYFGLSFVL